MPFVDVQATYDELRDELDFAYRRVMESGLYILGDEVEAFEQEFADYCDAEHCVAVASGLDALTLALRALGVGNGDEVVVPGHTFIATWLAVSAVGARPVPVDVDEATGNLDPALLGRAIGPAVRAVVPVHLYGQPAELGAIKAIADAHGIALLEDAAQAHGATLDGAPVGSFGRAAAFSFYPSKNLGAFGDGGAITTDDKDLAASARLHRNYGSERKYTHEVQGLNSRLDPLQAAFLRVKLAHLGSWNERRRSIARRYLEEIEERPGTVQLPRTLRGAESVWHVFVIRSGHRDKLSEHLRSHGIETLIHYPTPPYLSGAYADAGPWQALPVSERLAASVLSLPIGPHLDEECVSRVIDAVNRFKVPGVPHRPAAASRRSAKPRSTLPRVSCVMGTYLHERYIRRALDTLLAQDYPSDALEIVLVDDGSPDRTPELVEPYLDRIRYIRKENAGLVDTVNVCLSAASGDYIGFFSGDDETPPGSVRRRVELLERRPEVGLCFGDLEVIDAESNLIAPSFFEAYGITPRRGHVLGELLRRNFVSGGSIMVRASLLPRFHPLPEEVAWEDWWTALKVSEVAELDYLEEPVSRYRLHGENLVGGATGAKLVAAMRKEMRFRRYALRALDTSGATPNHLMDAVDALHTTARQLAEHDGLPIAAAYGVGPEDRARASIGASAALAELDNNPERGFRLAVQALADDPGSPELAATLRDLHAAQSARIGIAAEVDGLLAGVREHATLAFADELIAAPRLLSTYAEVIAPSDPATLVIYAPDCEPASLEPQLLRALAKAGVEEASCPDLLAVVTRANHGIERELARRARAVLTMRPLPERFGGLQPFDARGSFPS